MIYASDATHGQGEVGSGSSRRGGRRHAVKKEKKKKRRRSGRKVSDGKAVLNKR